MLKVITHDNYFVFATVPKCNFKMRINDNIMSKQGCIIQSRTSIVSFTD